jgi:hypothetical protein
MAWIKKNKINISLFIFFVVFQTKHFSFLPSGFNNNNNTLFLSLPLATVTLYLRSSAAHQHIPVHRHQYFFEDCW